MGRKRTNNDNVGGLLGLHGASQSGEQLPKRSALVDLLLRRHLWGDMPATMVQLVCQAAVQDGVELPDVKLLAQAGTKGLHTGPTWEEIEGTHDYPRLEKALWLGGLWESLSY